MNIKRYTQSRKYQTDNMQQYPKLQEKYHKVDIKNNKYFQDQQDSNQSQQDNIFLKVNQYLSTKVHQSFDSEEQQKIILRKQNQKFQDNLIKKQIINQNKQSQENDSQGSSLGLGQENYQIQQNINHQKKDSLNKQTQETYLLSQQKFHNKQQKQIKVERNLQNNNNNQIDSSDSSQYQKTITEITKIWKNIKEDQNIKKQNRKKQQIKIQQQKQVRKDQIIKKKIEIVKQEKLEKKQEKKIQKKKQEKKEKKKKQQSDQQQKRMFELFKKWYRKQKQIQSSEENDQSDEDNKDRIKILIKQEQYIPIKRQQRQQIKVQKSSRRLNQSDLELAQLCQQISEISQLDISNGSNQRERPKINHRQPSISQRAQNPPIILRNILERRQQPRQPISTLITLQQIHQILGERMLKTFRKDQMQHLLKIRFQYFHSQYFHVGKRRQSLNAALKIIQIQQELTKYLGLFTNMVGVPNQFKEIKSDDTKIINLGKNIANQITKHKQSIKNTYSKYYQGNVFHVSPRCQMLSFVEYTINQITEYQKYDRINIYENIHNQQQNQFRNLYPNNNFSYSLNSTLNSRRG